jgi:hypothetical protein
VDPGERGGEGEVLGQPARAVHPDRLVQDPLHGERGGDLDGLDLGVGDLVALGAISQAALSTSGRRTTQLGVPSLTS